MRETVAGRAGNAGLPADAVGSEKGAHNLWSLRNWPEEGVRTRPMTAAGDDSTSTLTPKSTFVTAMKSAAGTPFPETSPTTNQRRSPSSRKS